jgi:cytochrome c oxidase subunit 2
MLAIGAIASAIGIALGLLIDWFPVQASGQAKKIDTLWDVLLIFSVPIFVLVEVVVLYSVWKFRMRPGEELEDGPPIHGNTRLEVIWTTIPAVLLVCLCSYAYIVLHDVEEAQAHEMQVRVVGEQFAWTFHYRDGNGELTSNQLYLPEGRPVRFTVQSKDVIHDFWVPAFRMKIDAVPGLTTGYRVTPTRRGSYPVVCAELCGLGHSVMRSTVHVLTPQAYGQWFARLRSRSRAGGGTAAGGAAAGGSASTRGQVDGKAIFTSAQPTACSSCHTLADAGSNATTGPNLDQVLKGRDKAFIRESIVDPNAEIAQGYQAGIMPQTYEQSLDPQALDALVSYLAKVTK